MHLFSFLNLKCNNINLIEGRAFTYISTPLLVNLENNKLDILEHNIFYNVTLAVLNLINNPLTQLDMDILAGITIDRILASTFEICCTMSDSKCSSTIPKPWYLSCFRLLKKGERITYICVSLCVFVLDIYSGYLILTKRKGPYGNILVSFHLTHFLAASYIALMWPADLHYSDNFVFRMSDWISTATCAIAFLVMTIFTALLPILMSFLSLSIHSVTMHPLDSQFKSTHHVKKWISYIVLLILFVSLSTTLIWRFVSEIKSFLCTPFEDPAKLFWHTKFITISILFVQLSSIVFIIVCHCMTVKEMKVSGEKVGRKANISKGKTVKFSCITGSNTVSWLSSSNIFTTCLFLETYPVEMISWTAGVVIPLSSLINPILFAISSRQRDKKPVA